MDTRWIKVGITLSGAIALLAVASPAFAAVEGSGTGHEANSNLTLSISPKTPTSGKTQYTFTVGNIDHTKANTEIYFRTLTQSQYKEFSNNDDVGTIISASAISPSTTQRKWPGTETFTTTAIPTGTAYVTVAQYSPDRSKEYEGEGIAPVPSLPTGQMPEVPFAVGLPLVGLAVGVLMWRGRRRLGTGA